MLMLLNAVQVAADVTASIWLPHHYHANNQCVNLVSLWWPARQMVT